MLTRGRAANHIYVSVVGDGDPHSMIRPDTSPPPTATELLEQILARDASPIRHHPAREQHDPAARLGAAVARYLDALHLAAEHLTGPQVAASLDQSADHLLKGLTREPAWPTLRGHLLLLAAAGADPVAELLTAAAAAGPDAAPMIRPLSSTRGSTTSTRSPPGGRCRGCRAFPHRIAADPGWGPYLAARSHLVAQLADQVRLNTAGEAPAWAIQPTHSRAGRADRRRAGVARRHPGRPQRPATHRATPTRPRRPSLATATRQATRRRTPTETGNGGNCSPQKSPVPPRTHSCRSWRKVEQPHPGRLRCHPARAVGGRRRTPTRRPPRRSPLVAHPRSATGNAEPGACNPRGSPSDPAHDHDLTRQAATAAALGAPSRVRAEPLKTSTHHNAGEVFRRTCCRTLLLIKDGFFEVVPGNQVRGYDISVRDGSARRSGQLWGMSLTCANTTYPKGVHPEGYEGGDASSSPLTTGTCPRSLWRKNDTRRTTANHDRQPARRNAMSSTQRATVPDTPRADDELLTMQEVADVVRVPVATLRYWRHLGTGPRSFRIGRSVRYWRTEVFAWLDDQANGDRQSVV